MQPYEAPCRLAWRDWRTAWCSGAALWQVQRDISAIWRHISARVGDAPRPQARTPGASDHLIMHWFRRSEVLCATVRATGLMAATALEDGSVAQWEAHVADPRHRLLSAAGSFLFRQTFYPL
ncbi:hypothetical protein VDGL01_00415 [Verticillium dahliae]